MKSITIIDDNNVDCLLISSWLTPNNNYKVIHNYHSGIDVVMNNSLQSDYCIIDVCMPLLNGIDTSILLLKKGFKGKILLVSHAYYHEYAIKAREAGAHGYCRKEKDTIIGSLYRIEKEANFFDDSAYADWRNLSIKYDLRHKDMDGKITLLNPHYRKILRYSCTGFTTEEMSELMGLKKHTIEQYRAAMLQQLGFKSIGQATAWAVASQVINHSEVFTLPPPNDRN